MDFTLVIITTLGRYIWVFGHPSPVDYHHYDPLIVGYWPRPSIGIGIGMPAFCLLDSITITTFQTFFWHWRTFVGKANRPDSFPMSLLTGQTQPHRSSPLHSLPATSSFLVASPPISIQPAPRLCCPLPPSPSTHLPYRSILAANQPWRLATITTSLIGAHFLASTLPASTRQTVFTLYELHVRVCDPLSQESSPQQFDQGNSAQFGPTRPIDSTNYFSSISLVFVCFLILLSISKLLTLV